MRKYHKQKLNGAMTERQIHKWKMKQVTEWCTTSGVMSIGGFNVCFACSGCGSDNLPLPTVSPLLESSTGIASSFCTFGIIYEY